MRSLSSLVLSARSSLSADSEAAAGAAAVADAGADLGAVVRPALSPRPDGPLDVSEVPSEVLAALVDLGALLVPQLPGLRMSVTVSGSLVSQLSVSGFPGGYQVALALFSAPRSWGVWEESLSALLASLGVGSDAAVRRPSPFGAGAVVSLVEPDAFVSLYVFGVSGPGWTLRCSVQRRTPRPSSVPRGQEAAAGELDARSRDSAPLGGGASSAGASLSEAAVVDPETVDPETVDPETGDPAVPEAAAPMSDARERVEFPVSAVVSVAEDGWPEVPGLRELVCSVVVRRGPEPRRIGERLPLRVDPAFLPSGVDLSDAAGDAVAAGRFPYSILPS